MVGQRADAIQRYAERLGVKIERPDAIELVGTTIGRFTLGDDDTGFGVITDETRAQVKKFQALNEAGGPENLKLKLDAIETKYQTQASKIDRAITATLRSAVTGKPIDSETAKLFESTPAAEKQQLDVEIPLLESRMAEMSRQLKIGDTKGAAELRAVARKVTALRERRNNLVDNTQQP